MTWSSISSKLIAKREIIEIEIQEILDGLKEEEHVSYKFYENCESQIQDLIKEWRGTNRELRTKILKRKCRPIRII